MQHNTQIIVDAYEKHKNLKLAAADLGMKWQSLYVHLRKAGVAVTGDKSRYGSSSDRLAVVGERKFAAAVPLAKNLNEKSFQPKCDFDVLGYMVDVKAARLTLQNKRHVGTRWSFSIKKQMFLADFFVCFCLGDQDSTAKVLLVPGELVRDIQSVSVGHNSRGKWSDYELAESDLAEFFTSLPKKA